MNTKIKTVGICYVLVRLPQKAHAIAHRRHDLVWYPETGMSLVDCVTYKPYVKSIVTENPWLIACYSRENVRVWDKDRGWVEPVRQTYGASHDSITSTILGIKQSIPSTAYDGGIAIQKLIDELTESYPGV